MQILFGIHSQEFWYTDHSPIDSMVVLLATPGFYSQVEIFEVRLNLVILNTDNSNCGFSPSNEVISLVC